MRILSGIILLLIASFMVTSLSAEVFTWKDANGNTVFGDSPPESVGAREVELPQLTIADSYSSGDDGENKQAVATAVESDESDVEDEDSTVEYSKFSVKSPAKGAAVRANNGNVLVKFHLQPALQAGHGLVVYLDGKQVARGSATAFSLQEVDRGQHSLFAVLHDQNNDVLKNTQAVKFNVLRASRI